MRFAKIIASTLFIVCIAGCAIKQYDTSFSSYQKYTAKQLYSKGNLALNKKNYDQAIKYFQALDAIYPFGAYAQRGQLAIIKAYYKNSKLESTLAATDRYLHLYPTDKSADYAFYMQGVAYFELHKSITDKIYAKDPAERDLANLRKAFGAFSTLLRLYPNSKYAADARNRMFYIRDTIGRHEIQAAKFYLVRKAYVAAANRAVYVVNHLEGTPQVAKALKIMVKAYRALGATKQAQDALIVLQKNYPKAAKKL